MNRRWAVEYAEQLVSHRDTDPGIREFAKAYLGLHRLVEETATLLLDPEADYGELTDKVRGLAAAMRMSHWRLLP